MKHLLRTLIVAACGIVFGTAQATQLTVDVRQAKSSAEATQFVDAAVRQFAQNMAQLTAEHRAKLKRAGLYDPRIKFSLPARVRMVGAPARKGPLAPGDITLVFETTGARAFPTEYRNLLQSVFNQSKNTLDLIFGGSAEAGPVRVRNYDADIPDREAVSGGIYIATNLQGEREIRFPVYTSREAAAVNFVHTLLLAYQGDTTYTYDAFEEGLVRAATMRVVRTAGAMPATLDAEVLESVLKNTYDVSPFYEWYNQRALASSHFIAPNLRNTPLPAGGSLGGIYLLRYQMAGTAWYKLLVENAGFVKELNRRMYADVSLAGNVPGLVQQAQAALDTVKGAAGSRIEGLLFADWFRRQHVLDTTNNNGPKLLLQPLPLAPELGSNDFGVFDLAVTYFETTSGGEETLLSGTSYPIFWEPTFQRVFTTAQEDVLNIAGAYGSVTPNFPQLFGTTPYRITVDIPVGDRNARTHLPVGAISTSKNPDGNDFYGTVLAPAQPAGSVLKVRLTIGSAVNTVPVTNFAFGAKIGSALFLGNARLKVEVLRTQNNADTVLHTRFVNKGPGELALDLRVGGDVNYSVPGGILKGISMIGFPIEPFASSPGEVFGIFPDDVLVARYNQSRAGYDIYPDTGTIEQGLGYFIRSDVAKAVTVPGRAQPGAAVTVALKPGWNMIAVPINETVLPTRVRVVSKTDFPMAFTDAQGTSIASDFFRFVRGNADPVSGAPESGTYTPATSFQPGQAYFIRCLVPDGLSLVFYPASILPGKIESAPPVNGWQIKATVADGVARSEALMAQTSTATRSYDKREDSPLPPRSGGLQVVVDSSSEGLYKDTRRIDSPETYTLRLEGLKPYKSYSINFTREKGYLYSFTMRDPLFGVVRPTTFPFSYTFTARSTTHKIEVLVHGGSR